MIHATASYTVLSSTIAIVEVTYPNGRFGIERVQAPRHGSLYEAAYGAACTKATIHGFTLGRFSESE